jgi:AraC-like DNA-binding protein
MPKETRHEKKKLEFTFPFLTWDSDNISFPPHWHDCFELIFMRKGHVYVSVDDIICEANEGDLIMVNAGTVHGYFNQSPVTWIQGLQFDIAFFDEWFSELRDAIFRSPVLDKLTMPEESYRRLLNLLGVITSEYREKSRGYQFAVKAKLYELMLMILRDMPEQNISGIGKAEKSSNRSIKQIVSFVFKNFDDPDLCLEATAELLHLNKFYFTRFFKKHTGQSFHAYLTKTRVDFAKRYLIESKMTITDVAFRTGFGSLQTFNRVFKSLTGHTPRDYRGQNRAFPTESPAQFGVPSLFPTGKKLSKKSIIE